MAELPTQADLERRSQPEAVRETRAHQAGITVGENADLHAGRDIIGRDYVEVHVRADQEPRLRRRRPAPTVPSLPEQFIARPELLAEVKAALLQPNSGQAARMVGLVGMGGAGKSMLAIAVARDPEIVAAFPDGIVRLDAGPSPDFVAQQARLTSLLGDPRPVVDTQQGLDRLNELLDGAALLLLLDNVWDRDYLDAFALLVPGCVVLATTRDHDVLDHGAATIPVGTLPEPQARELLAAWSGQHPGCWPDNADQVARACGGLPLALAVAGGMVADGRSWSNVLRRLQRADLDKLHARFAAYPYPDLLRALDASVNGLATEERARYLDLAVFDGQGPVLGDVVQWWWQQRGLDELDAEDLLARLIRRSAAPLFSTIRLVAV
jgi:hypothetical protein